MRARAVIVGIDIGTTNWKVVAYDESGQPLAGLRRPVMVHEEPGGRAHYDPEEVWGFVVGGLREVARQLGPDGARQVVGIAATSMGEAGVLVDEAGLPVYPAIAWFDPRTEPQGRFWREKVDPYRVYEVTGFPPQYIASINKVMWIREHEAARFARARRWLCMADYVAFRLSGEQAMDFSLACRTMAFDIRRRTWSGELLGLAGIDPALFPPAVPSGTALGRLRPEVAEVTGLPSSAVVAAGGQDHWCGALAAGIVAPGDVLDSVGTAEAIIVVLDRPVFSRELFESGFAVGCHVVPERYYAVGALQTAGGAVEWLRAAVGELEEEAARQAGEGAAGVYRRLMALAEQAPPGSRGLLFLPHLRGAVTPPDGLSKGAWVGLRPYHRRSELVRAVIEGLSHEFAYIVHRLAALTGTPTRRVAAIGGGARNDLWLQLKADIGGIPLEVSAIEEATTLGAALLGGVGAGIWKDPVEAARHVHRVSRTVMPRSEMTRRYRPYHELYQQLYPTLAALHARLEELSSE